jgi:transposase-like protein
LTEKRRREIARAYRRMLDKNVLRKNAIAETCRNNGIDRATLYRWCRRFDVPTN